MPHEAFVKDLFMDVACGGVAGIASELCEYPFDVVKTRLQAQLMAPSTAKLRFSGPLHCFHSTWREEGIRGLYRGIPAPVVGSMAETAALFVSYTFFQTSIRKFTANTDPETPLTIPQLALAGAGAGLAASFIVTPIELVKCKMQVQMMNLPTPVRTPPIGIPNTKIPVNLSSSFHAISLEDRRRVPGSISIIKTILTTSGVPGLFLGHSGTMLRETGGSAAWFVCKEFCARQLLARRLPEHGVPSHVLDQDLLAWESGLSGAVAGAACVLALYPADTVKSAMQTMDELRPATSTSLKTPPPPAFIRTFRTIYGAYGIRGLYAGCGLTMLRAVPGSAIVFVVYDGLQKFLGAALA